MIVILAGALGAVLRFVVDSAVKYRRTHRFPWTTLLINLTGSALIGLLAAQIGVSQMHVSRILSETLRYLREQMV